MIIFRLVDGMAKSSPLALLAAHCSKIGSGSPPPSAAALNPAAAAAAVASNWFNAFPKFEEPFSCYQQLSADSTSPAAAAASLTSR